MDNTYFIRDLAGVWHCILMMPFGRNSHDEGIELWITVLVGLQTYSSFRNLS